MTWDEFKAEVDRLLEELGYDGTLTVKYIDTTTFPEARGDREHCAACIDVTVDPKDNNMAVT